MKLSPTAVKWVLKIVRDVHDLGGIVVRRHDSINIAFLEVNATMWYVSAPPRERRARLTDAEYVRLQRELEYVLHHPECKFETCDMGTHKNYRITGPLLPPTHSRSITSAQSSCVEFVKRWALPELVTAKMLNDSMINDPVGRILKREADACLRDAKMRVPVETGRFSSGGFMDSIQAMSRVHRMPLFYGMDMGAGKSYTGIRPSLLIVDDPMEDKPVLKKVVNPFYVASPSVTSVAEQTTKNTKDLATRPSSPGKWTRPTLKAALEHANAMLDADPKLDHVAVTQIVRIVRRRKLPNIVETVKG